MSDDSTVFFAHGGIWVIWAGSDWIRRLWLFWIYLIFLKFFNLKLVKIMSLKNHIF